MPEKTDPFHAFESLVQNLVQIPSAAPVPIELKIGLLERLIERWRIDRHQLENAITFENFPSWDWLMDERMLHFTQKRGITPSPGSGIPPIRYQRTLLVYLLLHHQGNKARIPVLNIIRNFIAEIRDSLSPVDFKKTETGVIRCFTNTRFAANKLREYGLLKYTTVEAFKTWTLSLPGIIVAARALKQPDWKIPVIHRNMMMGESLSGLDPLILSASSSVEDFPAMVDALTAICRPDVEIFKTFEGVLMEAQKLLKKYWAALNNAALTQKERSKLSLDYAQAIEGIPFFDEFIEELVDSIEIEKLLKTATAAAQS
jgi:hypothetical protein